MVTKRWRLSGKEVGILLSYGYSGQLLARTFREWFAHSNNGSPALEGEVQDALQVAGGTVNYVLLIEHIARYFVGREHRAVVDEERLVASFRKVSTDRLFFLADICFYRNVDAYITLADLADSCLSPSTHAASPASVIDLIKTVRSVVGSD